MASGDLWREWIRLNDAYSPELEYSKAVGDALRDFESSLLSDDTAIWSVRAQASTPVEAEEINYRQLVSSSADLIPNEETAYRFYFINRFLLKDESSQEPPDAHKLRISGEALRFLASRNFVPPSFLYALSRFYLPNGRGFRRYQDSDGRQSWYQWYFLPMRVQVPCTDKQRSHATSSTGKNQMNPFHYLHLPDEKVDIRGSQIAVHVRHDGRTNATTTVAFNFLPGRWHKLIEEPQNRMAEALEHPNVPSDPMLIHLVFLTTIIRWWNNALHSVNEQLIAYEKQLQEDDSEVSKKTASYGEINRTLHAMAAHVQRYGTELDSLEETTDELAKVFATIHGPESASLVGIDHVKCQLKATSAFVKEQEKKAQNILALEQLFSRIQLSNDRLMVENGRAMQGILQATQAEAASSRTIATRSQQLSEAMKKDSVSMKTIAILTMFFLPATSYAALLAMPFFATNEYLEDVHKVWVWVVLTVPTTGGTYAFYRYWRRREERRDAARSADIEMSVMNTTRNLAAVTDDDASAPK